MIISIFTGLIIINQQYESDILNMENIRKTLICNHLVDGEVYDLSIVI